MAGNSRAFGMLLMSMVKAHGRGRWRLMRQADVVVIFKQDTRLDQFCSSLSCFHNQRTTRC